MNMKHFTGVLVVLLIAAIVAFGFSYKYRNDSNVGSAELTTVSTAKNESTTGSQKRVVLEDEENNYKLSTDGNTVFLSYKGFEQEFPDWFELINQEIPQIYCKDYDNDGEKELLMKLYRSYDSEFDVNLYNLIFIKLVTQEDGSKEFLVVANSDNTWRLPLSETVNSEMTQLKSCKKYIQFVMDNVPEKILYDSKTGITTNEHVGFARALASSKGEYYTLDNWTKGNAIYTIDDKGNAFVDIQLLAYYEEIDEPQLVGFIHGGIGYINKELTLVPKTIYFAAQSGFEISDPRDTAESDWSVEISNSSNVSEISDNNIDWIDSEFEISKLSSEQTMSFSNMTSKIKLVDSIKFTQGSITLTAREDCTFSSSMASSGAYSVVINDGEKENANIAYTCEIKTVKKRSTLVITLDKTYDKEDIEKMTIKFGA